MIGIYKITSPSGKIYVGQSNDIDRRFREYKNINTSKKQIKLHNSFKKHGIDNHIFSIIQCCEINELNKKERYYQELLDCTGTNGLNLKLQSADSLKELHSAETICKISIAMKLKHQDENYKSKMVLSRKKIFKSEQNKDNLSKIVREKILNNTFHLKIGVFGEFSPRSKKVIDVESSIIYYSAKEASNKLNINYSRLKGILQGKTKNKSFQYL